ncbi:MAG: hypothetical protein AAGI23_12365 [Bacteroidota bacterium]
MKSIFTLFVFSLFYFTSAQSQDSYSLLWDRYGSAITSAENLYTLHAATYAFKDRYLKHSYWDESTKKGKALGIGYRLGKTVLVDFQIDYFAVLFQHEVFGHGYRYREFGFERNSYNILVGPPYSKGGGFASRGRSLRDIYLDEHSTMSFGGSESNTVFANTIRDYWWTTNTISYSSTLLYGMTRHDLTRYILRTKYLEERGDVVAYAIFLKERENADGQSIIDDAARHTLINLLDPYSYIAGIAYLKYLINAEEEMTLPTLHLGNVDWLPTVQFNLTPFGGEFQLVNSFRTQRTMWHTTFRHGDNRFENFWGIGGQWLQLPSKKLQVGATLDLWQQPSSRIGRAGADSEIVTRDGLGGRVIGHLRLPLTQALQMRADVGYKTTGYTLGEALDRGLILRVGLSFVSPTE